MLKKDRNCYDPAAFSQMLRTLKELRKLKKADEQAKINPNLRKGK